MPQFWKVWSKAYRYDGTMFDKNVTFALIYSGSEWQHSWIWYAIAYRLRQYHKHACLEVPTLDNHIVVHSWKISFEI